MTAHRAHDRRTLRVEMRGEGVRTVRVAYVVETPLWKSTYRLILPPDGDTPHVRFDERGGETGRCLLAQATASLLDCTPDVPF